MNYHVTHTTTYDYRQLVTLCHNVAHLIPRSSPRQQCQASSLTVTPEPAVIDTHIDYFGNPVSFFTLQQPHRRLVVRAEHTTEVFPVPIIDIARSPTWEDVRNRLGIDRSPDGLDAYAYAFDSPYIRVNAELADYARLSFTPGRPLLDALLDLTRRIHAEFRYDPKATTLSTTTTEVLAGRRGVCQDFAHLAIGCMRSFGQAARYVSGYMRTQPPPGQARLVGADASHAWLAVWCPGFGWVDADPTNGVFPGDQHITLAWGRDYDDVSPIKGVIHGGGEHTVKVEVDVAPA